MCQCRRCGEATESRPTNPFSTKILLGGRPSAEPQALRFPLPANRAGEEMGIDFANAIERWFYFRVLEAGSSEGAPPLIRGEKTRIRSKFRIDIHVGEAIQDLKHQFRIHRLVEVGAHALTDYQRAIGRERLTSLN